MRDARIERLLGGYATNTLTEAERQALFEAALNDQELFDALQDEEVLRDLLADGDSRQAISRALQQPASKSAKPWFAQGWVWGLAGTAAATCAVVLVVISSRTSYQPPSTVAELKSPEAVVIPAAPAPAPVPKTLKRRAVAPAAREQTKDVVAPAAVPPQQEQARTADQVVEVQSRSAQAAPQVASSAAFRAAEGTMYKKAEIIAIPYSVWKRGADGQFTPLTPGELLQRGDVVRVVVRPPLSGSLTVSEQSPGGLQLSLNVTAGQEYTVPDSPIQVMGERQLRLVLTTAAPTFTVATNILLAPGKPSNGR